MTSVHARGMAGVSDVGGVLSPNPDWAGLPLFERTGWRTLPFGDFAQSVNERVEPAEAAEEIYVGLDDLDSGDLHIRRWGKGSDVTGTKLRFRKGDIIFGRRRAYQRKLAVAEFDGICSAHAMVVRAKAGLVLPEFLPFLMMSDRFMKRAVEISVGSLSPTINWTTLKREVFALPPLDLQRRLAELLWAVDEAEQAHVSLACAVKALHSAVVESEVSSFLSGHRETAGALWSQSPDSGCSAPPSRTNTGHYVLSLAALSERGYVPGKLKPVEPTEAMLNARLSTGDLLVSRSNTQELVGFVGVFDEDRDDVSFPDTMMRMHFDEKRILKRFAETVLLSSHGRLHMMQSAAGTSGSMKKINRRTLGQCILPVPPLGEQRRFLCEAAGIRSVQLRSQSTASLTSALKAALLMAVFS